MSSFSRRAFLKGGLAATVSAALIGLPPGVTAAEAARKPAASQPLRRAKGYCPFCQVRCTYHALVQGNTIREIEGDAANRWTGGGMCPKGLSMLELVQSPHRLVRPMRKIEGAWREIGYEDALSLIAETITASAQKHGRAAGERAALTMPLWDCRESELSALMLMRLMGAAATMPAGEVCISSASQALAMLTGSGLSTTTVDEILNTQTLILWGANLSETYPVYSRWLEKARSAGVRILYVDCRRTPTSVWADAQYRPLPGTDGALLLGACRAVFSAGLRDRAGVEALSIGLESLEQGAAPWTLEKVAAATGMAPFEVDDLYRHIVASERTVIWMGGSLCRYANGMQTVRTLLSLQALTGNLIGKGRGVMGMEAGKPEGEKEFVDAVCGPSSANPVNFRRLLASMKRGNLDVLFLNSSYRRYPDCNAVAAAISKVAEKGLVVYRGHFHTEEMDVANLFIPATFGPESSGTHYGAEKHVVWRERIVDAPGACVPDWKFYSDLGRRVFPEKYPSFQEPEELAERFRNSVHGWKGITLERLRQSPDGVLWPLPETDSVERTGSIFTEGRYLTEDGKFPFALSLLGPYQWTPPKGSPLGPEKREAFPLILIQGKIAAQWQQTLTNTVERLAQFSHGRYVLVHPDTARALGIADNDEVALTTELGSIPARAEVTDAIRPGVVFTPSHFMGSSPCPETRSAPVNTILPNAWDRVSAQFNGGGCTLKKIRGA